MKKICFRAKCFFLDVTPDVAAEQRGFPNNAEQEKHFSDFLSRNIKTNSAAESKCEYKFSLHRKTFHQLVSFSKMVKPSPSSIIAQSSPIMT